MIAKSRKQALLNEYKGSLFEFLVAKNIAENQNIQQIYLSQFTQDEFSLYAQQEDYVRNFYPEYLVFLINAAKEAADYISADLDLNSCSEVNVVGKTRAALSQDYDECDILIKAKENYKISLKLAKANSFVNTKSAGVKSFISKYFAIEGSERAQLLFNQKWELEYEIMARQMHAEVDLEYTHGFDHWNKVRDDVLPGQLTDGLKTILHDFYAKMNTYLYEQLVLLYQQDNKSFKESLVSLSGFSHTQIYQLTYFYKDINDAESSSIHWGKSDLNLTDSELELNFKCSKTNILIMLADHILQLRIKAMNTFTSKGYKINCAVKS